MCVCRVKRWEGGGLLYEAGVLQDIIPPIIKQAYRLFPKPILLRFSSCLLRMSACFMVVC